MNITPQHIQEFLQMLSSEDSQEFIQSISRDLNIPDEWNPLIWIFNAIKSQYPELKQIKVIQEIESTIFTLEEQKRGILSWEVNLEDLESNTEENDW